MTAKIFHSVKAALGFTFPNYDVSALSHYVCGINNWNCTGIQFYTGIPDEADKPMWNHFWNAKAAQMGRGGVKVFMRPLKYRNKEVRLPDGTTYAFLDGDEKGIDVRLALDVIRLAHKAEYDVAVIFSRDQDLSEVADEIRATSIDQKRWIKIASAFPYSPAVKHFRGINNTHWVRPPTRLASIKETTGRKSLPHQLPQHELPRPRLTRYCTLLLQAPQASLPPFAMSLSSRTLAVSSPAPP